MKIKHVTAEDNWNLYTARRRQIVEIYNKHSSLHQEEPRLNKHDLVDLHLLHVYFSPTAKGGILVEQLYGQEHLSIITFAGIAEDSRNKGICQALVEFAVNDLQGKSMLAGVQLNVSDNDKYWYRFGWTEKFQRPDGTFVLTS